MNREPFNYFVVTTWQYGKNQYSTVVRVPIGHTFLDSAKARYWSGKGWLKSDHLAKKYTPGGGAFRAMNRLARMAVRS